MKKRLIYIILLSIIFGTILIHITYFFTRTVGVNDCMITYVETAIQHSNFKGFFYNIDGENHVENTISDNGDLSPLEQYKKGNVKGCIFEGGSLGDIYVNTTYCGVTYVILKTEKLITIN